MIKIKGEYLMKLKERENSKIKLGVSDIEIRGKRDITINSRISQHQAITVEEGIIIKCRKEQDKPKSKRYRDKKRATNFINLQTDEPSKTIAKHVPERQNFHTSQTLGLSTRNIPYIPPTHTLNAVGLSIRNELYIPISYSGYNSDVQINIPLQENYVPQLDESIMVNYA
ncbi:hypothetical protein TNCV_4042681 [Trichonephila clavipes]|nr:hypothetical protein TNCV_4042681 [Trichonephila clavipes]